MMNFQEFLMMKEKGLIDGVGFDNWFNKKVYFPYEVVKFVQEFEKYTQEQNDVKGGLDENG